MTDWSGNTAPPILSVNCVTSKPLAVLFTGEVCMVHLLAKRHKPEQNIVAVTDGNRLL